MSAITEKLMSVFDNVYKELSKWDMRNATSDNPVAGLTFLVFLKHISDNKEALGLEYPEKLSFDYLVLLYGEKISSDELIHYISDIEQQLGYNNGILASFVREIDLLKLTLQFKRFLEIINTLDFKITVDNQYEVYDALVSYISLQSRKEIRFAGEYITDVNLSKLMAKIANVNTDMSVYDFACGYSISLSEAVRGKNAVIYAQDINKISAAVSIMILTIAMNKNVIVQCNNSITSPLTINYERGNNKFDRVISAPPFGLRTTSMDERIQSVQLEMAFEYGLSYKLTGDLVFARHLLATLKDDGIGILLMPVGALFRGGSEGKIREQMIKDNYIDAVIELPTGIIANTGVKTALVVFKKNRKNKDVYILDASRDAAKEYVERVGRVGNKISDYGVNAIGELVSKRKEVEGLSRLVSSEEIIDNSVNLCAGAYLQLYVENLLEVQDIEELKERNVVLHKKFEHLEKRFNEIIERL